MARYFRCLSARGPSRDNNCRGATAVEMALIAPTFFFLLVGVTEMSLILTAQQLMEHAAFSTSRLAKTGFVNEGETQTETVSQILIQELNSFGSFFDTNNVVMTSTSYDSFGDIGNDGKGKDDMGNAGQIVVYTITYPWKIFTPFVGEIIGTDGTLTLSTRMVVRNEPYS